MIFRKYFLLPILILFCGFTLFAQNFITVTDADLIGDSSYTWTANNQYLLDGIVILEAGSSLTIEPGTVIRGKEVPSDALMYSSFLIIEAEAQLIADGTPEQPIVFTSENDNLLITEIPLAFFSGPGNWGGLIIAGRAPVSGTSDRRRQRTRFIRDLEEQTGRVLNYAGEDEEDNSGIIRYVSVRNAGRGTAERQSNPGVILMGLGRGTTVDHLEVHNPSLFGLQLFGGTVDLYHLLSSYNQYPFSLEWGYKGRGQFWFGLGSSNLLLVGEESQDNPDDDTSPNLANLTLLSNTSSFLGTFGLVSFEGKSRGKLKRSVVSENRFFNSISIDNLQRDGTDTSLDRFRRGGIIIEDNIFISRDEGDTWDDQVGLNTLNNGSTSPAPDSVINAIAALNSLSFDTLLRSSAIRRPISLNPTPKPNTPIFFNDGFPVPEEGFTPVDYKGAFGLDDDWWHWTYLYQVAGNRNVSGQVLQANSDCTLSDNPIPAAGVIVQLQREGEDYFATTDAEGFYSSDIPEGPTTVAVLAPNDSWFACPGPEAFSLDRNADTILNLALAPVQECAVPSVAIGTPFLRRGFDNRYTITYSNTGTVTATNPELKILLDTSFIYLNTDFPANEISFSDDTIIFQLPDLEPLAPVQSFWIDVNVSIESELGQEHCTYAQITADNACEIQGLRVDADCLGDSVRFRVQNTLSTDLPGPVPFVVIEDEVMLRQGSLELMANAAQSFTFPAADATTYHFSTISGDVNLRTAATLICGNNPGLPAITFPLVDGAPDVAIDCQINIGAYDPNDKSAVPLGLSQDKIIPEQSEIDYRIRFQNTGTDTAFQVIVIDTLPEALDPATIQMGAMSHSGTWTLEGERILKVIFDNIMLPDSNVNEPASNGFFKFRISAREEAGAGTEVVNEADIYFDFNLPIRTNFTFHQIGDFRDETSSSSSPENNSNQFSLYPQPAEDIVTIKLSDGASTGRSWAAYAIDGRLVADGRVLNQLQQITVSAWSRGSYIIVLRDKNHRVVGVKKLLLQ